MDDKEFDKAMQVASATIAELHEQIGSISTGFAHLELELINALGLLLDDGDLLVGQIVADKLSYSHTVDLFVRLGSHRLESDTALMQLKALVSKLREAARLRNDVVHSSWTCSLDEKPTLYQERVRRKHTSRERSMGTIPMKDFPEIDRFMNDLFVQLEDFETEYL